MIERFKKLSKTNGDNTTKMSGENLSKSNGENLWRTDSYGQCRGMCCEYGKEQDDVGVATRGVVRTADATEQSD